MYVSIFFWLFAEFWLSQNLIEIKVMFIPSLFFTNLWQISWFKCVLYMNLSCSPTIGFLCFWHSPSNSLEILGLVSGRWQHMCVFTVNLFIMDIVSSYVYSLFLIFESTHSCVLLIWILNNMWNILPLVLVVSSHAVKFSWISSHVLFLPCNLLCLWHWIKSVEMWWPTPQHWLSYLNGLP